MREAGPEQIEKENGVRVRIEIVLIRLSAEESWSVVRLELI